ncbi:EAL domain-containing protein [Arthrobacter sp. UYEF3]|uniref:putative bifunctional diguanylate cyclase/phosphodiesterase n=1 Tax=Arthrobacter sp. UYEF3 TaxID=1756365 RepID=UPI00339B9024
MNPGEGVEDPRLEQLVDGIVRLAAGELNARIEPSEQGDAIDAVITGVNLLAEELGHIYADLEERVAVRTATLRRTQVELERMAKTDALTGLANRIMLNERIHDAIRTGTDNGHAPAVLILDLDSFKAINDTLGHSAGDAVLVEVSCRLRSVVQASDTVARLGGDEFAVLITGASDDEVMLIAHRSWEALQEGVEIGAETVWATGSIGICLHDPGQSAEELVRDADIAMYQAKAQGRNRVQLFHPDMLNVVQERSRITGELRMAASSGQLALHYQPVIELASGKVTGIEALLRWHHPVRGTIMPDSFIGLAEETGLILELGRWVLNEGIAQLGRWKQEAPQLTEFRLHINLSAAELLRSDLLADVNETLTKNDIEPARLVLEITESVLMSRRTGEQQVLEKLRALGVGLHIDDFGTGYSSISYLRALPADTVKVDRSLIKNLETDPRQQKFVSAILQLISAAELEAIVEGIETAEQAARLQAMGCLYGQGYYFGRPAPAAAILDRIRGSEPRL